MSVLLVSTCADPLSEAEFVKPIRAIVESAGHVVTVRHYRRLDPPDLEAADKIILCGTALQDDAYLEDLSAFGWLAAIETPVLGVCSGMQVVALACGARLTEGQEIGMVEVETVAQNPLCADTFPAYALHRHSLEGLEQFQVLARSVACPQVIRHRQRPLFGVLFHPEVRNMGVVRRFLGLEMGLKSRQKH